MYSIGLDIGYSSAKMVAIDSAGRIEFSKYELHKGKIVQVLKNMIEEFKLEYGTENVKFGAVTGSASKVLSGCGLAVKINEATALVEGGLKIDDRIGSIIEIGGQSAKYITEFTPNDKSRIKISMNSSCSAGTGSFLEEQMSRLGLRLEDYSQYAQRAKSIPRIAGRCSVFAKTDITHHQQEGVSVEDILLGLAYAVAGNYKGTIMRRFPVEKPVMFAGGVTRNNGIITALKDILKLEDDELLVPEHCECAAALGTAAIALEKGMGIDLGAIEGMLGRMDGKGVHINIEGDDGDTEELPRLMHVRAEEIKNRHICGMRSGGNEACYLGVDIGSTSTNLVVMDEKSEIISYRYINTLGTPARAIRQGLKEIEEELGEGIKVMGVGITGSGRYMIGRLIGADVIKDEITAQARAAISIDKEVDTIFEIGGQDSKYIGIENGVVKDFQMNKICAAGTGSFIEEQSKKIQHTYRGFRESGSGK